MAALNILLLQDTQYLLTAYNTRPTFRKMFDDLVKKKTRVVFRSRPLKTYVYAMITISPKYEYYRNQIRQDQSKISELFKEYYLDPKSGIRLIEQSINNPNTTTISDQDHSEINRIEQLPPKEKVLVYEKFLEDKDKEKKESPPAGSGRPQIPQEVFKEILKEETPTKTNIPKPEFKIPSTLKNISSQGQILARRGGINAVRGIGGMFKGVSGNLLGGGAKLGTGALQFGGRGLVAAGAAIGGSAGAPIIVAVLVVLGVLIVGPLLMNLLESESFLPPFKQNVSTAEAAGITNISSCKFYRGGDPTPATQIANPLLASKITEISDKVGVPPAVIAGIMRVETGQALTSTSDYISNDYDAHFSKDEEDNPVAFGIMQFTPGTFIGTFNNNKARLQTLFNKTSVSTSIDSQNALSPASVLRIYNITDSIIAAAFKVSSDKNSINGNGLWDEATIRKIAERYYGVNRDGTTNYTGFDGSTQNYGNDLWTSVQNCKTISNSSTLASCPIPNGVIKTPSFSASPTAGHCSPAYGSCRADSRRAQAIDVDTQGQNVVFPLIGGQKVNWFFLNQFPLNKPTDCEGGVANCGVGLVFQTTLGSESWVLNLLHIDPYDIKFSQQDANESGGVVGKTVSKVYAHIEIGKNLKNPGYTPPGDQDFDPGWIPADFMCNQKSVPNE